MASKYVKNAKQGTKGTDHAHIHKHTQGRKVQEDKDKSKERMTARSYTRYGKYVTKKRTKAPSTPSL